MKVSSVLSILSLAAAAAAAPLKRSTLTDIDILQFALTLEYIESTFYNTSLAKYSQQDFLDAGLEDWVRPRFQEIQEHEATHIQILTSAILAAGASPVQRCQYAYPDTDPLSMVDVSDSLETVGSSAYAGAASNLVNKSYVTTAVLIAEIESQQSTWLNAAVRRLVPWPGNFGILLSFNDVWSIASGFIVPGSCPSSNVQLPVLPFPALDIPATAVPGSTVSVSYNSTVNVTSPLYAAFLNGGGLPEATVYAPVENGEVTVPSFLSGTTYIFITTQSSGVLEDTNTIAGPEMFAWEYNSDGQLETPPF